MQSVTAARTAKSCVDIEDRSGNVLRRKHEFRKLPCPRGQRAIGREIKRQRFMQRARPARLASPGRTSQPVRSSFGHARRRQNIFRQDPDRRSDHRPRHRLRFRNRPAENLRLRSPASPRYPMPRARPANPDSVRAIGISRRGRTRAMRFVSARTYRRSVLVSPRSTKVTLRRRSGGQKPGGIDSTLCPADAAIGPGTRMMRSPSGIFHALRKASTRSGRIDRGIEQLRVDRIGDDGDALARNIEAVDHRRRGERRMHDHMIAARQRRLIERAQAAPRRNGFGQIGDEPDREVARSPRARSRPRRRYRHARYRRARAR